MLGSLGNSFPGPGPAPSVPESSSVSMSVIRPAPSSISLAEASRRVGFQLQTPDPASLPAGFDKTPQVQVIPANEYRYTFDKSKAAAYYRAQNRPEVNLPDKFD